jgi:DNA-binding transcriptional LysR family regulator
MPSGPFLRAVSIRHLRLVSVLGRELNISRSAELLHSTQPALSRSLAQLEDLLGAKLFNRSTKRVSMTPAGVLLMQHANRILAELDLAEENLRGMQGGTRGEVRVGMLPVFSSDLLGRAVTQAREIAPQIAFSVEMLRVQELFDALLSGRIDLMLSHTEFEVDLNATEVFELYSEQSAILVASDHPLTRRRSVSAGMLALYPWVLPGPETPLRRQINRLLSLHRRSAPNPIRDVQTESLLLAASLVRNSDMVWSIAHRIAQQLALSGGLHLLEISTPMLAGPMCAFHLRDTPMTPSTKVLLNCLRDLATDNPADAQKPGP